MQDLKLFKYSTETLPEYGKSFNYTESYILAKDINNIIKKTGKAFVLSPDRKLATASAYYSIDRCEDRFTIEELPVEVLEYKGEADE